MSGVQAILCLRHYHFPSLGFSFPCCKEGSNTCPISQGLQVLMGSANQTGL